MFMNRLKLRWEAGCHVCVGLDTVADKIPPHLFSKSGVALNLEEALLFQLQSVVDETKNVACAFKPNFGFYASMPYFLGYRVLAGVINFIHNTAPAVPVILDGKWNDIGNSSERYAFAALDRQVFGADAVTVNPYLGGGAISPFMEMKGGDDGKTILSRDTGVLILCRTSNLDAAEIQDMPVAVSYTQLRELGFSREEIRGFRGSGCCQVLPSQDCSPLEACNFGIPLYLWIAILVSKKWNKHHNCGLVVGATVPEQLRNVRVIVGDDVPILIPGVGKQGGKIEEIVPAGMNSLGAGMLINNSSGILSASSGPDFAEKAGEVATKMNDDIKKAIAATRVVARSN